MTSVKPVSWHGHSCESGFWTPWQKLERSPISRFPHKSCFYGPFSRQMEAIQPEGITSLWAKSDRKHGQKLPPLVDGKGTEWSRAPFQHAVARNLAAILWPSIFTCVRTRLRWSRTKPEFGGC